MSLKTKLTSLITTFVLLCSLLTVGVFAVKNTTFNVGGDIVFNVQGIEADIELTANGVQNAEFNNDEEIGKDVLKKIEIRNNTSADSIAQQFAKWSNLDMTFAEGQSTAIIELKITNRATEADNYIDITALADATTKENARIKVVNNAGGITALLKSGENATFTITFSVIDDEYKASLNDFSVNFDMQKKVLADFPILSSDMTYQTLKFRTINGQTGLSVEDIGAEQSIEEGKDYYQSTGDVAIPSYVNNGGIVYPITKISYCAFGDESGNKFAELNNISIPRTITSIDYAAFCGCNLGDLFVPCSIEFQNNSSFYRARVESVTIEYGIETIFGFEEVNSLTNIEIPNSVIYIGSYAFVGTNLSNVIIPEGVTNIEYNAFYSCSDMTSITIPSSLTNIGEFAFDGCTSLTTVNYRGTEAQWNALLENVDEGNDYLKNATKVYNYAG